MSKEYRNPKIKWTHTTSCFAGLDFEILASFLIRHSSFGFPDWLRGEPLRSSFLLFCREEVEFRMASRQARQSFFIGFGDQGAHGLDEGWEIERLFKQRADPRAQRGKKLVGPGGDDDDGQKRVS